MSSELARGFLLLCDKDLEEQAQTLATIIRTTSGRITLKTLDNVEEAKGTHFHQKLDNILNVYARAVVIISSRNFADLIDKKNKSKCPDVLQVKFKESVAVLKSFFEKEAKRIPHKIILVSVNGDTAVPKALKGMTVLVNDGDSKSFNNKLVSQLITKLTVT